MCKQTGLNVLNESVFALHHRFQVSDDGYDVYLVSLSVELVCVNCQSLKEEVSFS